MKNIDRISSLEELSAKLEVNVDSVVKEFYFAVKGHIEFYQDDISVNPMVYVDKKLIAYPHPTRNFVNPYVTSRYSGMMFSIAV